MSQFVSLYLLLDSFAILSLLIGILTSSLILFIIICKLTRHHAIANLLFANTCICTLELCLSFLVIYGFIIKNDFTSTTHLTSAYDQQNLCPIRSYFLFTGFGLLYTSYCLQAYYRLAQVIYYKKQYTCQKFIYLCIIQWIFSFLLVLPMLLTKAFVYLPTEFFCPIPFTKPLSVTYIAVSVYGVFITIFATIYFRIYRYAGRTTMISIQRRRIINRQFTMLKRMILPTFSLMFLGIVYLTMFFQALSNQYQAHFLTYRLSYLFIAVGMSFIHVITISQTPRLKKGISRLFKCSQIRGDQRKESEGNGGQGKSDSSIMAKKKSTTSSPNYIEIKMSQLEEKAISKS